MTAAEEIGAALAALCPPEVGCAAVALDGELPPLWPGEEAEVAHAVARRKREFAGGRAAARMAMRAVGVAPAALPSLPDRCPRWPTNVRGSIAHSGSVAIAAVGLISAWRGIGLDLEGEGQVGHDLADEVLRPDERQRDLDLTTAFCAKEAAQKALFPACRTLLAFHDLTLRPRGDNLAAELQCSAGPLRAGLELQVRVARAGGHMLAVVFWPSMAARNRSPSFAASASMS